MWGRGASAPPTRTQNGDFMSGIRTGYIYCHRTDKANTFKGTVAITGATTIAGALTVTGTLTANGDFAFGDAYTDALTISGALAFGTGACSTYAAYNTITAAKCRIPFTSGGTTYYIVGYQTVA